MKNKEASAGLTIKPRITFFPVGNYEDQFIYPAQITLDDITRQDGRFHKGVPAWDSIDKSLTEEVEPVSLRDLTEQPIVESLLAPGIKSEIPGGWQAKRYAFELVLPRREISNAVHFIIILGYTSPATSISNDLLLFPSRAINVHRAIHSTPDGNKTITHVLRDDIILRTHNEMSLGSDLKPHRPEDLFQRGDSKSFYNMGAMENFSILDMRNSFLGDRTFCSKATNDSPEEFMRTALAAYAMAVKDAAEQGSAGDDILQESGNICRETNPMYTYPLVDLTRDTNYINDGFFKMGEMLSTLDHLGEFEVREIRSHGQTTLPQHADEESPAQRIVTKIVDIASALTAHSGAMKMRIGVNGFRVSVNFTDEDMITGVNPYKNIVNVLCDQISNTVALAIRHLNLDIVDISIDYDLRTEARAVVVLDSAPPVVVRIPLFAKDILSPVVR